MIKKLRKKFILINMSLVTLVLLIVFGVVLFNSYHRYVDDSMQALERALNQPVGESLRPKLELGMGEKEKKGFNMAVFVVTVQENGEISHADDSAINISEESIRQAVEAATGDGRDNGYLRNLSLRYSKRVTETETTYAFVDCSREQEGMKTLLVSTLLMFLGGIAAFLIISFFLAKWALKPVEAAWEQQKRFVADASHELKTPLTIILANLGILAGHPQDTIEVQKRWLNNTRTEAKRMKKLLDDLLFLARSDAKRAPLNMESFDVSNALWSCILPFESLAYEQEVELTEEIEESLEMKGDLNQIKQLFVILLDNACKYAGEKGRVHIILRKKQEKLHMEISNTGESISEEDLSHIFERFYRADESRVRKEGGYGLGLSIASTIVENHHGKITAGKNGLGETTFRLMLPLA